MENNSTLENLSRLERLPVEIVYEIYNNTPPEVLIKLRAASLTLKYYVDKYSLLIEMPSVHSVQIVGPGKLSPTSYVKFTITIPYSERKKFELRLVRGPPIGLLEGMINDKVYCFYFDPECNDTSALEYLGECLGTHIKSVELRNCTGPASALLVGKNVAELTVFGEQLSAETINSLLQMCSTNSVAHVVLHVIGFANNDPGEFLLNLSSHVTSLKITHATEWKIDTQVGIHWLFGVAHVDWAPIIIEMFARRMEKLNLTNQWTNGYLSRESADLLIEKLPLLEKKFSFETSCKQYDEGLNFERNGCTIRADSGDNGFLSTRHLAIYNRNDFPY